MSDVRFSHVRLQKYKLSLMLKLRFVFGEKVSVYLAHNLVVSARQRHSQILSLKIVLVHSIPLWNTKHCCVKMLWPNYIRTHDVIEVLSLFLDVCCPPPAMCVFLSVRPSVRGPPSPQFWATFIFRKSLGEARRDSMLPSILVCFPKEIQSLTEAKLRTVLSWSVAQRDVFLAKTKKTKTFSGQSTSEVAQSVKTFYHSTMSSKQPTEEKCPWFLILSGSAWMPVRTHTLTFDSVVAHLVASAHMWGGRTRVVQAAAATWTSWSGILATGWHGVWCGRWQLIITEFHLGREGLSLPLHGQTMEKLNHGVCVCVPLTCVATKAKAYLRP